MNLRITEFKKIQPDVIAVSSLATVLIILGALYMYFVSASVLHVVMRQEIERNISTVNSEISQLETKYIAAQHALSAEIASLDGYVEANTKIFINREDTTLVLGQITTP